MSVVAVDTDLPAEQLALIGCAVMTGVGAALVRRGSSRHRSLPWWVAGEWGSSSCKVLASPVRPGSWRSIPFRGSEKPQR